MYKPLGFVENGVNYYIFATKRSVLVIGMSNSFSIITKGETFKETIAEAQTIIAKKALIN
ncbi:hypothetical protein [Cytobacillus sp.]|uniref:hypothetical protein n=1 Tax=Cytobacillus sp. TaxID=2675269 RepID=UPI0028BE47ED|nr:hypothetical protein [Cytobacillus sp.]